MISSIHIVDILLHPVRTAMQFGTVPLYNGVNYDAKTYVERTPEYKILKKFLHKIFTLVVNGQIKLQKQKLKKSDAILFLYTGKNSLGDANLELSGRALLKGKEYNIDLLTLPKLQVQFSDDDVFKNVYSNIEDVNIKKYSSILMSELNHRSLKVKNRYFKKLPFSTLFWYFDGPSRDQATFSYFAFNDIFDLGLSSEFIVNIAKPYINCAELTKEGIKSEIPNQNFICISVGGVDKYRTYNNWGDLILLIEGYVARSNIETVVLIGSENGIEDAAIICNKKYKNINIVNMVGKLTILQTLAFIERAQLFVGCDGGLMHVAHSTNTHSVTIFSDKEPNMYWLTPACNSTPLQSIGEASKVSVSDVFNAIVNKLSIKT